MGLGVQGPIQQTRSRVTFLIALPGPDCHPSQGRGWVLDRDPWSLGVLETRRGCCEVAGGCLVQLGLDTSPPPGQPTGTPSVGSDVR